MLRYARNDHQRSGAGQQRFDFGEGLGDFGGRNFDVQLTRNLRCGDNAADHLLVFTLVAIHHQGVGTAGLLQSCDDIADAAAVDIFHADHFELVLRRHDVLHQDVAISAAMLLDMLDRLGAVQIGRSNQPDNGIVVIHYQQQAHAAVLHARIGGLDRGLFRNRQRTDLLEVRYHRNCRIIQLDEVENPLGTMERSPIFQFGGSDRGVFNFGHGASPLFFTDKSRVFALVLCYANNRKRLIKIFDGSTPLPLSLNVKLAKRAFVPLLAGLSGFAANPGGDTPCERAFRERAGVRETGSANSAPGMANLPCPLAVRDVRLFVRFNKGGKFVQCQPIHFALELDHRFEGNPVMVPAPGVEFGMTGGAQPDIAIAPDQAQQIPDLLLPTVTAAPLALDPVLRHVVVQPALGAPEDAHVLRQQSDFFMQFAEHCLVRRLAGLDATLRELPGMFPDPLAPEYLVPGIAQNYADVGAVTVLVNHF